MHNRKSDRQIRIMLLIVYALLMFCLMFVFRSQSEQPRLTLKLFSSSRLFIQMYRVGSVTDKLKAVGNLAGNFIMFIPIGLLFPGIWKAQRKYPIFLATVILLISVLEGGQYFTRLGTADIDDLLFNTIGASIGYVIYMIGHRSTKK